jgi:hypothetical protein
MMMITNTPGCIKIMVMVTLKYGGMGIADRP